MRTRLFLDNDLEISISVGLGMMASAGHVCLVCLKALLFRWAKNAHFFALVFVVGQNAHAVENNIDVPQAISSPNDFSGRWMLLEVASTQAELVVLGAVDSELQVALLLDLHHKNDRLFGSGRVCMFRLHSPTSLVRVEFPRGFRDALSRPILDAELFHQGNTTFFRQSPLFLVMGASLRRPRGEPLPLHQLDPRVIDADGDGKPGVTVRVHGIIDGEIYLVQRTWSALHGRSVHTERFEGDLVHGKEEVVLGATHQILSVFPKTRPNPEKSFFVLEKTAANAGCDEANAQLERVVKERALR